MMLRFNGQDVSSYVDEPGYTVKRRYVQLKDDIMTLDKVRHPASRKEFNDLFIPIINLSTEEYALLCSKITKPTLQVTFLHPEFGVKTITCTLQDVDMKPFLETDTTTYWEKFVLSLEDCG